jgi:hypothetical protein
MRDLKLDDDEVMVGEQGEGNACCGRDARE